MERVNIIQSYWSKPAIENRWSVDNQEEVNVLLCEASCKLAQRNGATVTMHTDSYGAKLLGHIPYDDIIVDLDMLDDVPTFIWACGKMVALSNSSLGSIHIDNDVLLMEPKTVEALCFEGYDCIVQQLEPNDTIETKKMYNANREAVRYLGYYPSLDILHNEAYNTGVLGFYSEFLRSEFLTNYFQHVVTYKDAVPKEKIDKVLKNKSLSPDLILEQVALHQFSKDYKVKELLNSNCLSADVEKLNYRHLLGATKYSMKNEISNLLKKL